MKKATLLLSLALFMLSGCKWDRVSGSGATKIDKRSVPAFTSVDISGAYEVEIVAQKGQSVEIEGDDNLLPLIKTEVRDSVLEISNEKSISTKNKLRVRISVQQLDGIETSGASNIVVSNVKSDDFKIHSSGASELKVSGEAKSLSIDSSGAGAIDTKDLHAEKANVHSSGAATAEVYATEELAATVSGGGIVGYYGNPKNVKEDKSGAGTIIKR
ncbi:MAG TPA: head GIN domain-containing protein [Pyrinomonadaceae bacterium]